MKPTIRRLSVPLLLAGGLAFCLSAAAQQAEQSSEQRLQYYDQRREVSLSGSVVKFETSSSVPPLGAHVLLQTSSGQVDVHLGKAQILQASHLELNPGDNVRIIGETIAVGSGTTFAARIVQKGTQVVAVRSPRGFPLKSPASLTPEQKEALRGVR
jgi:hypothetical protein